MFQLRDDHVRGFESVAANNFEERGVQHLRRVLPDVTAPFSDGQLRLRVRESVNRAARYGLTSEQQIMAFVDATYLAGERFDTQCAWAAPVLVNANLDGDSKSLLVVSLAHAESTRKG